MKAQRYTVTVLFWVGTAIAATRLNDVSAQVSAVTSHCSGHRDWMYSPLPAHSRRPRRRRDRHSGGGDSLRAVEHHAGPAGRPHPGRGDGIGRSPVGGHHGVPARRLGRRAACAACGRPSAGHRRDRPDAADADRQGRTRAVVAPDRELSPDAARGIPAEGGFGFGNVCAVTIKRLGHQ
jgi:hypothetical protein